MLTNPKAAANVTGTHTVCTGPCSGYKTKLSCPPLIVLAVRSVEGTPLCCRGRS